MIAVITYDAPHRKTQDLIYRLITSGYWQKLFMIILPWDNKKKRKVLYEHRPGLFNSVSNDELCEYLGIPCIRLKPCDLYDYFNRNSFEHILIGGAGLLPKDVVMHHNIINVHPGYLPNTRGLDALKWAILEGQPIGVTAHYISDKPDAGTLIAREMIPVYFYDTFHSLAMRVYEQEISMFVEAIRVIDSGVCLSESLNDDRYDLHQRMPLLLEPVMLERFEKIRKTNMPN